MPLVKMILILFEYIYECAVMFMRYIWSLVLDTIKMKRLVNLVPRTFYDFEVICRHLFFRFIRVLSFQVVKTVSIFQLLTIFEKTPS